MSLYKKVMHFKKWSGFFGPSCTYIVCGCVLFSPVFVFAFIGCVPELKRLID